LSGAFGHHVLGQNVTGCISDSTNLKLSDIGSSGYGYRVKRNKY
jgi:hypothetical protein